MLKPKQALEIIKNRANVRISLDTFYGWIKNGKLKVKRLGGMILIDPTDLDFFLADFCDADRKVGMS